jgi:hypothetical protein
MTPNRGHITSVGVHVPRQVGSWIINEPVDEGVDGGLFWPGGDDGRNMPFQQAGIHRRAEVSQLRRIVVGEYVPRGGGIATASPSTGLESFPRLGDGPRDDNTTFV